MGELAHTLLELVLERNVLNCIDAMTVVTFCPIIAIFVTAQSHPMPIKVRYFASLKELTGHAEQSIETIGPMAVKQIWQAANPGKAMPDNTLAAVNMDYVGQDYLVNDNDEVAFFPPVTGG